MSHDTEKCSRVTYSFSKHQLSIYSVLALETAGSSRGKLGQAACCSGTLILFRETDTKQVEKYPHRKWSAGDNKQGDTVETAWEKGGGGCCGLDGQGGPLGGGDPELRTRQEVARKQR